MSMIPAITVVGCDGSPLRGNAAAALAAACCVAGTRRHLAVNDLPSGADRIEIGSRTSSPGTAVPQPSQPRPAVLPSGSPFGSSPTQVTGDTSGTQQATDGFDAVLDAIMSHRGPVAVLASGDPGFFGIVRAIAERGASPTVLPAPSSVAVAFARLGLPWDDALVLSAHGRNPRPVLAAALGCAKAAILTAPGQFAGPRRFITPLIEAGRLVYVAERLGAPDERLTQLPFDGRAPGRPEQTPEFADPNLVIALDPSPA